MNTEQSLGRGVDGRIKLSRRDILMAGSITVLSLFSLSAVRWLDDQSDQNNKIEPFVDIGGQEDEMRYGYSGEARDSINKIFSDYGIAIYSIKKFSGETHLKWPDETIKLLADTIRQMPPEYLKVRKLKTIFLFRKPGTGAPNQPGIGGSYRGGYMSLSIAELFSLDSQLLGGEVGNIYHTTKRLFQGTICHELTHCYAQDGDPEVMKKWISKTGWSLRKDGIWVNSNPEGLSKELTSNYKTPTPDEDMAISTARVMFATTSPGAISPERRQFFADTPPYSTWKPVIDMKKQGF